MVLLANPGLKPWAIFIPSLPRRLSPDVLVPIFKEDRVRRDCLFALRRQRLRASLRQRGTDYLPT